MRPEVDLGDLRRRGPLRPDPALPSLAWPLTPEAGVAATAAEVRDWPSLIGLARSQHLLGLLAVRLLDVRPRVVPEDVLAGLAEVRRLTTESAVQAIGHAVRVVRLFEAEGIAVLLIKGPALSQDLYGDPTVRSFCDLDFVVRPEDAVRARQTLLDNGFEDDGAFNERLLRRGMRSEGEVALVGKRGIPRIDLHWRLTVGYSTRAISTDRLLASARSLTLLGQRIPAPDALHQLLLGVLHGARHDWTPLELRLEVALQVARLPQAAWPQLCATARELGCLRRLLVGVAHACGPFAVPVPAEVQRLLRADRLAPRYAAYLRRVACRDAEPRRTLAFADGVPGAWWQAASEDDVRGALDHLFVWAARPNRADWAAVDLPDGLGGLYWVLRPARIARDHAWRPRRRGAARGTSRLAVAGSPAP